MVAKASTANDQIVVRAAPELIERAEALVDFLSDLRGHRVTKSHVYREALMEGLAVLERRSKKTER